MPYNSPQVALQKLKEGNIRFVEGKSTQKDYKTQVQETSNSQFPFAIILSCIDSRSPSEIIFDQGIGDIFNARIAGNIVDEDILGSMEFACKVTGSRLILVMGHSNCGAIRGACDEVKLGNLTSLLAKIKPAVDAVESSLGNRTSDSHEFVEKVAKENVMLSLKNIRDNSPILKEMIDNGEIILVGSMYDVKTGKVEFFE